MRIGRDYRLLHHDTITLVYLPDRKDAGQLMLTDTPFRSSPTLPSLCAPLCPAEHQNQL